MRVVFNKEGCTTLILLFKAFFNNMNKFYF